MNDNLQQLLPQHFLRQIRKRTSLRSVVGRRVDLARSGKEFLGLCPFHRETTPSFTVNEIKGFYHCFGCGAHGDAINFFMRSESISFNEAAFRLAEKVDLYDLETASFIFSLHDIDEEVEHKIYDQIAKCTKRLRDKDFDGAITSARTLVEFVLWEIEFSMTGSRSNFDGDLGKLYKKVQKILKLEPSLYEPEPSLRKISGGFVTVVSGIAELRNRLGDSHATRYRAERHHAVLAVNAAKSLCQFLVSSYQYQIARDGKKSA